MGLSCESKIYNRYIRELDTRTISDFFIRYLVNSMGYIFYYLFHSPQIVESNNLIFLEGVEISGSNNTRTIKFEDIRVHVPLPKILIVALKRKQLVDHRKQPNEEQTSLVEEVQPIMTMPTSPIQNNGQVELKRSSKVRKLAFLWLSCLSCWMWVWFWTKNDLMNLSQVMNEDNSSL